MVCEFSVSAFLFFSQHAHQIASNMCLSPLQVVTKRGPHRMPGSSLHWDFPIERCPHFSEDGFPVRTRSITIKSSIIHQWLRVSGIFLGGVDGCSDVLVCPIILQLNSMIITLQYCSTLTPVHGSSTNWTPASHSRARKPLQSPAHG